MQNANVNCKVLKNYFDFLIKQDVVKEKCVEHEKIVYAITERGLYLIRFFNDLNQVTPTVRINTKAKTGLKENEYKEFC